MKILFNTDQIYLHGGIEKVMATKANYFASVPDYEVFVLTTEQEGKAACYPLDESVIQIDLNINYDRTKSYFTLKNASKVFKHFRAQRKVLNALRPDIIISPNFNFDHYWLPFVKPSSARLLKEIHASGFATPHLRKNSNFFKRMIFFFNDIIIGKYDAVVVLNEDEKEYYFTKNLVVIPNPIQSQKGKALLSKKQVIAAGRIAPVKGFDQLIDAWKMVHQKQPEWQLHIYGDAYGMTKVNLQQKIDKYQLNNVILIKESINDIPNTMLDYSIYAMSSVTECFPMVLLEALSVGLPVVSYDCPNGPRNIITHLQDGLLTVNQSPTALAIGILELIENEPTRNKMGNNAKINSRKFLTDNVMQQWMQLFNDLKNKKL